MFNSMSATKALDISNFNLMVRDVVRNHEQKINSQQKCKGCDIPFNGRSQHDRCDSCGGHYHKRCLVNSNHQCKPLSSSLHRASSSVTPQVAQTTMGIEGEGSRTPEVVSEPTIVLSQPALVTPPLTLVSSDSLPLIYNAGAVTGATSTTLIASPPAANDASGTNLLDVIASPSMDIEPTANAASSHQVKTSKARAKKNGVNNLPATDKGGFELECKRKQLITAHAKIMELESENTKIKKTNYILGERIKMFENANDKEMFEKYFPPKPAMNETHQSSPTHCSSNHCCPPPPCRCCNRCHGSHAAPDLSVSIRELFEKVTVLSTNVAAMKAELVTLVRPVLPTPRSYDVTGSTPHDTPLSPDIIVIDSESYQVTPDNSIAPVLNSHDQSTSSESNTIDDNVPDDLNTSSHLNCHVLTNQLPQLMHPTSQEH